LVILLVRPRCGPREEETHAMNLEPLTLDVRDDIRAGRDPLARIMDAVPPLKPDQSLALINVFEPPPPYGVMSARGSNIRGCLRFRVTVGLVAPRSVPFGLFGDCGMAHKTGVQALTHAVATDRSWST
jgi:hypothetical protein